MHFLVIDTSSERGMIAYGSDEKLLFEKELPFGLNQSKFLMPYLVEALHPFDHPPELDGIGVGIGPGSYTGIRLGVAVAQALSYSWEVPLIGICSLKGFVPTEPHVHFAALLDARIGGVYFQKGWKTPDGILYEEGPRVYTLAEVGNHLEGVTHLVTSHAKSLKAKLKEHYPNREWIWQERSPSAQVLLHRAKQQLIRGQIVIPPAHLNLLYLRETEAERTKGQKKN